MSQKLSRSTDLDEPIAKARAAGLAPVADVYETLQDILKIVEVIEAADAGRLVPHEGKHQFS
jgi:hypothetical protein